MITQYQPPTMDINEAIKDLRGLEMPEGTRIWKPFMEKYDCQSICELGVREGDNFMRMIEHQPKIAVAVDSWVEDGNAGRNDLGYSQEALDTQYESFKRMVRDKTSVQIYREYTFDAVRHFPDEYFDLIYIDADHTYDGFSKDINDWFSKVKRGKFLTGDDLSNVILHNGVRFGVIEAIIRFCEDNKLTFYVLPDNGWAIVK